jgi:hypothetical protein
VKHAKAQKRRRFPVLATLMTALLVGAGVTVYELRDAFGNIQITTDKHWVQMPPTESPTPQK